MGPAGNAGIGNRLRGCGCAHQFLAHSVYIAQSDEVTEETKACLNPQKENTQRIFLEADFFSSSTGRILRANSPPDWR